MALIRVDTEALLADAGTFQDWSNQLRSIWVNGIGRLTLSSIDFGTQFGTPELAAQYRDALARLHNYVVGGDGPGDEGGVGVLDCFVRVLRGSQQDYDEAEAEAAARVARLQREW